MREFYKQVRVDKKEYRFFAECPLCGKRHYEQKLPLLCRSPQIVELVENGRAGRFRQHRYNKSRVAAIQVLARHYNLCRCCGEWVCNDCFLPAADEGLCAKCKGKIS